MSTNPFDMDGLLGAYALDALDDDERRAVEDYLASSPRARQEVQEHREVATMLAWSGMDAPDGLWDKISGSLEGRAEAPAENLGKVLSLREPKRRRMARTVGSWVVASAAAAAIAVVAVNVTRDDPPSDIRASAAEMFADPSLRHAQLANNDSLKVLAVVDQDGNGFLRAEVLPNLGTERTYQLWGQVGEQLISLGLIGPDPDLITFTAREDVTLLAITDEVKGGVISSQNQPVVAGALA